MRSWVIYSVSAYVGLLLAGSISATEHLPPRPEEPVASMYNPAALPPIPAEKYYLVPRSEPQNPSNRTES